MAISSDTATALARRHLGDGDWQAEAFGAGRFSETFRLSGPAGGHVLRVAPPDDLLQLFYEYRMMRREPALHERLLAETSIPVPQIVAHDFSRKALDRDYLLMPLLAGEPLNRAGLAPDGQNRALQQWGRHVAEAHSLTEPQNRFGYIGGDGCMQPRDNWADAFCEMYRRELDDIVGCGIYDQSTATEAMDLLEANRDVFRSAETSRLLHGDLWVTNLMVDAGGNVTALLDWDRACWGDIEWDLAIAEYCGVTRPAFWSGYGREVPTHDGPAAVRRLFYLLYEHQKYIVISMSARRNDPAGAKRYAGESLTAMRRFARTGKPVF